MTSEKSYYCPMLRFLCLALALLLASCSSLVETKRQLDIDSVETRATPSPEFRGAGMYVDNSSIVLEGHVTYRNELDAEPAKGKKQEDYSLGYNLGNTPIEGAFSVLFKGEGPFLKITTGADYFPFVGLIFGVNTKRFEAGGFIFDHFWDRTYRIKGTMYEETFHYSGSSRIECMWDNSYCKLDSVEKSKRDVDYEEFLMTHHYGLGLFASVFIGDFVLEYSGSFYTVSITEEPEVEEVKLGDDWPLVTTQRISFGYNFTPNYSVRFGGIHVAGDFDGSYWALSADFTYRFFIPKRKKARRAGDAEAP